MAPLDLTGVIFYLRSWPRLRPGAFEAGSTCEPSYRPRPLLGLGARRRGLQRCVGLAWTSRITPVEGAHYLGIPNIIFIRYEGKPQPPFARYAMPFKSLKRVVWSVAGAGGATSSEERE